MRIWRSAAVATALASLALVPGAQAQDDPIAASAQLRDAVKLDGIAEHMGKLQAIANAHQGNRAAGTVGYDQSVSYVERKLDKAGYDVHLSPFDFPTWEENATPVLEMLTPTPTIYMAGTQAQNDNPAVDFITFEFSTSGTVDAPVIPTDGIVIPPPPGADTNTSGCDLGDFPPATSGAISLIQRGECTFTQKLDNAAAAGAAGVILFNEGNDAGRTNVIARGASPYYPIPAVGTSFAVGEDFYEAFIDGDDPTALLEVDAGTLPRRQDNVIADSPWGNAERAVVVGAHLDSVPEGPGINDNGSGVATNLEVAEQLAQLREQALAQLDAKKAAKLKAKDKLTKAKASDKKKRIKAAKKKLRKAKRKVAKSRKATRAFERQSVRFGFWGAEEAGLIGSSQYVAQLSADERAEILLNLNFDMLGSPNFARLVYDGNTDQTDPPPGGAPAGSGQIEQVFLDYFASQGLPTQPTAFDGRSDYGPFIVQGIPAGGLFSGAEEPKTAEQVTLFGGLAGEQLDPCYHVACDTYDAVFSSPVGLPQLAGNGAKSLDAMSDAVAHSVWFTVTEKDPLAVAKVKPRPKRLKDYRLDNMGPERTNPR